MIKLRDTKHKKTCRHHRVNIKKTISETSTLTSLENYKSWTMKVTVIPLVISGIETNPKGLVRALDELEIEGRT